MGQRQDLGFLRAYKEACKAASCGNIHDSHENTEGSGHENALGYALADTLNLAGAVVLRRVGCHGIAEGAHGHGGNAVDFL